MTPKDNELRMQIGLVVTHTDDELLFVRSEKNPNTLDALQAFADLVRQDEREACAKLCDKEKFLAYHLEAKYLPHGNNDILRIAEGASRCAHLIRARGNHG
jgi:hypothetical protein